MNIYTKIAHHNFQQDLIDPHWHLHEQKKKIAKAELKLIKLEDWPGSYF